MGAVASDALQSILSCPRRVNGRPRQMARNRGNQLCPSALATLKASTITEEECAG